MITDEEALLYLKKNMAEYIDSSHLEIINKVDNEDYIYYQVRDSRYGKDFSKSYFNGSWGIGFSLNYIYNKSLDKFEESKSEGITKIRKSLHDCFTQNELKAIFPEITHENLLTAILKWGVLENSHIYQIYKDAGMEPDNPWADLRINEKDHSQYKLKLNFFGPRFKEKFDETTALKAFCKRLDELNIHYSIDNEYIVVDRRYPPA